MVDQHLGAAYSNTNGCCLKALAATETDVLEQFIAVRVISKFYFIFVLLVHVSLLISYMYLLVAGLIMMYWYPLLNRTCPILAPVCRILSCLK